MSSRGLNRYGAKTHSFVLRVWLEETAEETGRDLWRGCITHVPSRTTRYFDALDDVTAFVQTYLQRWGAAPDSRSNQTKGASLPPSDQENN